MQLSDKGQSVDACNTNIVEYAASRYHICATNLSCRLVDRQNMLLVVTAAVGTDYYCICMVEFNHGSILQDNIT